MIRTLVRCLVFFFAAYILCADARPSVDYKQLVGLIKAGQIDQFRAALKGRTKDDINLSGRTILMSISITSGQPAAVKVLVEWGMDVNRPLPLSAAGEQIEITPLVYAVSGRAGSAVVQQLVASGADVNKASGGLRPLGLALSMGQYETAELLLDQGALAAQADELSGLTPLMELAVLSKDADAAVIEKLAKRLIAGGANINAQANRPATALGFAVLGGNPAVVRVLLQLGADPNTKNAKGESLLSVARNRRRDDLATILVEFGARP